LQGKERKETWP